MVRTMTLPAGIRPNRFRKRIVDGIVQIHDMDFDTTTTLRERLCVMNEAKVCLAGTPEDSFAHPYAVSRVKCADREFKQLQWEYSMWATHSVLVHSPKGRALAAARNWVGELLTPSILRTQALVRGFLHRRAMEMKRIMQRRITRITRKRKYEEIIDLTEETDTDEE